MIQGRPGWKKSPGELHLALATSCLALFSLPVSSCEVRMELWYSKSSKLSHPRPGREREAGEDLGTDQNLQVSES